MSEFEEELAALINKHSMENGSDTPDFVLARYLLGCLSVWNTALSQRREWYSGRFTRFHRAETPVRPETDNAP